MAEVQSERSLTARSMPDVLRHHASTRPDAPCFESDARTLTYRELAEEVAAAAHGLRARGLAPGDRVAAILSNDWPAIALWLACAEIGVVYLPINPAFSAAERDRVLEVAEPSLAIVEEAAVEPSEYLDRQAVAVVLVDGDLSPLASGGEPGAGEPPDPDALVSLLYTSGTTGTPKGVVHDHRFWNAFATVGYGESFGFGPDTRYLNVMPLFHVNGMGYAWTVLFNGGLLIQKERFSASAYWQWVRDHRANLSFVISAMVNMLLTRPEEPADAEHGLRYIATSAVVPDKTREFERRFETMLLSSYGMTEGGGTGERPDARRLGSAGVATSGVELRVVEPDADGNGPVEMRDRACGLSVGYWTAAEGLVQPIRGGGWFRTSDYGRLEDGFLFFAARERDRLRRAGENISAAEVEDALRAHPDILEAAVLGVPDPVVDEELKAFVLLAEGASVDAARIYEFLGARLAPFKRPRYWEFVADFPRTPTQRVKKHELVPDIDPTRVVDLGPRGSQGSDGAPGGAV